MDSAKGTRRVADSPLDAADVGFPYDDDRWRGRDDVRWCFNARMRKAQRTAEVPKYVQEAWIGQNGKRVPASMRSRPVRTFAKCKCCSRVWQKSDSAVAGAGTCAGSGPLQPTLKPVGPSSRLTSHHAAFGGARHEFEDSAKPRCC